MDDASPGPGGDHPVVEESAATPAAAADLAPAVPFGTEGG